MPLPLTATARRKACGFTLVEVLVTLAIMAVLAGLAWRGLDGMLRSRDATKASLERTTRLNTVMTQWEQDLLAIYDGNSVPALAFDGQSLRLSRTAEGGVRMVAWSLRAGVWQRWAGPVVTRAAELQDSWLRSQQLLGNEAEQLRLLEGVDDWQVYFFRGNAWSNSQSSAGVAAAPGVAASGPAPREPLPSGVRLQMRLNGQPLTRDIALLPAL